MSIIFKEIRTPEHNYIYDRNRNAILEVSDSECKELKALQTGNISEINSSILEKYQSYGFLTENMVEKIEHPCTSVLEHYIHNHLEKLTLQVTQRCNLRCKYCVYSGKYDNRDHSNSDMSFEIAKRAIDLYLESSNELDSLAIGFYGGEPLLNFDLINDCVTYVESRTNGKSVVFSMTTNGTLLSKKVVEFLAMKKFNLMISLDGSQQEHDEYRVFSNGKGSFSTIYKNLSMVQERYPQYYRTIIFNSVLNPKHDYQQVKSYFENDTLLASSDIFTNIVESMDLTEDVKFSEKFKIINKFDYFKLCLFMISRLNKQDVSKLVFPKRVFIYQRYEQLIKKGKIGCKCHHSGPCIPGTRRLFVNVKGDMFPCERVSETSEVMQIGDVYNGFNLNKCEALLNVGRITEDLCKECWALLHCSQCAQKADGKDHLSPELKVKHCKKSRQEAMSQLREICVLKELGCKFER